MQTRCRPGDLAIVVHAQNPSNLGLIVRVEGTYNQPQDTRFAETGVVWLCACSSPMTWVRGGKTVHALSGPIPDALLQPIRGMGSVKSLAGAREWPAKGSDDIPGDLRNPARA